MKKILCLILSLSILISVCPVIAAGEDAVYGTYDNPVLITEDINTVFYEAESYPSGTNYKSVADTSASGEAAIFLDEELSYTELSTKGDEAQYRLWINSANEGKIKIFVRMKINQGTKGTIVCAKNDDPLMDRVHYIASVGEYYWVCSDSYEVEADETFSLSLVLSSSRTYIDKFMITSDLCAFPNGAEEISDTVDFSYGAEYYSEPEHNPISEHPRLFINSENIDTIKANMTRDENINAYNSLLSDADTEPSDYKFQNSTAYILSNAFLAVMGEDSEKEQRATNAKTALFEALKLKSNLPTDRSTKDNMNKITNRMYYLALVYDWCFDYLSEEEKKEIAANMMFYMAEQEYTYPPIAISGVNNGHESEGDIFRGLLSCAIAIYDEYPDMYRTVGGKLFQEMIPARNYYYEMGNHTQGTHYNGTRLGSEFYLRAFLDSGVKEGLLNDNADELLMEYIFGLRSDNQVLRNGDHDASGTRNGPDVHPITMFYYGNYFNNPYIKNEYLRKVPSPAFSYSTSAMSEIQWLIFNNPDLEPRDFSELPYTYYTGDNGGVMYARTSWEQGMGKMSDGMAVRMNLETIYGAGHDHLDAGHFDIYYKGSLALDSGFYTGISTNHHRNYFKRTIAHNSMLLYDPDEAFAINGVSVENDGGQTAKTSNGGEASTLYERQKIGEILAADYYGENMYNPSFSYMKGDLTDAYSSDKMANYTRSFVFLNFYDDVYPGALIVFDKMTSKNADFKKAWLLHTQEEPQINGNTVIASKTEEGDNGRLINTTLLPDSSDADIEKVGGYDMRFSTNGINYQCDISNHAKDYGEWRIELSPKESRETDYFLNVLHVTENDDSIQPLTPEYFDVTAGDFAGVKIKDRVVLLNKGDEDATGCMFTLSGDGEYEILITGVTPGKWNITSDASSAPTSAVATENGSDLYFKGTAGTYQLRLDTSSSETLTRNLDYKNYIEESDEEYSYIRFNDIYHSAPFFEEDGKLFVGAEYIADYLDAPFEITDDSLNFYNDIYDTEISTDSDDIIFKDDIYYVSADALSDIFYVKWVKENDYIYNLTISKREIVKITTGDEFFDCAFTNQKALYIIEGTDVLYDKTVGIKLPSTYETKTNFAGVIRGTSDKSNIEITGDKPLFYACKTGYYIKISDITLKGNNITLIPENKEFGVLIGKNNSTKDLVLENITNYLNVKSPDSYASTICYTGALIGYRQDGYTLIKNCINYGNIDADFDLISETGSSTQNGTRAGGLIGTARANAADAVSVDVVNSFNYGSVSSFSGAAGGIYGVSYNSKVAVNIENCGNYGDVSSQAYYGGTGGIIGTGYTVNISESFNLGNISGGRMTGGLAGISRGTSLIENSFNAGDISSSAPTSTYYNCGIAYNYESEYALTVNCCYNIGSVSGTYGREISNASSASFNYYINENASDKNTVGEYISGSDLVKALPSGFLNSIWAYTAITDENKYAFPQLADNILISTDEAFTAEKDPVSLSEATDVIFGNPSDEEDAVTDPDTKEPVTTAYFVVPAKFSLLLGLDSGNVKFGIFLSENDGEHTEATCDVEIEGKRHSQGTFGILVYGSRVISGKTYYVRPYVKYNGIYYYGKSNSFVFGE